jgi:hypothetical protein
MSVPPAPEPEPTPPPPPEPPKKPDQPKKPTPPKETKRRGKSLHEQGIAAAWRMRELGAHASAVIFFHGTDEMTVASDAHRDIVKALIRRAYEDEIEKVEEADDDEDEFE